MAHFMKLIKILTLASCALVRCVLAILYSVWLAFRLSFMTSIGLLVFSALIFFVPSVYALNGAALRLNTFNGFRAFEVITAGDDPGGDGYRYAMPDTFDGAGAWLVDPNTVRVLVNHETADASVSEVDLNLVSLQTAISNMINSGNTGGVAFVISARQAYDRWSADGGASWTNTSNNSNTSFYRFCSGQAWAPNTYGTNRGFVDEIYIAPEEGATERLFAIDSANRDLYQLSGTVGSAVGGVGGMTFDSWENAALLDTGETGHVALLLSPDGGDRVLRMYVGEKGKDASGNNSNSFLARNGLAYGSWYYLNDTLPTGTSADGYFDTSAACALSATKFEDIDTSPSHPNRVVLGNQDSGVFTFIFNLDFSAGSFNSGTSAFSITKIADAGRSGNNSFNDPDNVDWTDATTLGGNIYPEGLIFVNEDSAEGEIWQMEPDGTNVIRAASTTVVAESTGIFDISWVVGFMPGSIMVVNNQGSPASMSVLIHPEATLLAGPSDFSGDGIINLYDYAVISMALLGYNSPSPNRNHACDLDYNGVIDISDLKKFVYYWLDEVP
jgi:hypothetical protein